MGKNQFIIAAVVLTLVIAGLFLWQNSNRGSQETQTPTGTTASASPLSESQDRASKEFTVTGSSYQFAPNQIAVNKGDTVKITFKNSGGIHDLVIDAFNVATKTIGSGETETIQFVADKVGSFEFYCSVGNHRAMGMKGTLIVK